MKKIVRVKDVTIGEGLPKICVPMVGETIPELVAEANFLMGLDLDLVEWRVDFFKEVENLDKVKQALQEIREVLVNKPIVFTFRSAKEGGQKEVSTSFYLKLNKLIAQTKLVEVIDVELFNDEEDVKKLVEAAHAVGVVVIISNHDFHKTPSKEEIISRLCKAQELGGDLPKIAVMPTCAEDVITLLDATRIMNEKYADGPIITMSMAGKGIISRLSGELFGSSLTFGAAKKVSAPGQISVVDLRKTIQLLHNNM
ncbi:type I 3-dehydroquinate dehydratase [Clostridium estertheticum]|uniref:type I 3-dehydroquinate dehydratase n=1 Tax=Clostridium estertheticum TaxID=238834 RepID=UPI001C7DC84F|nr:type I 3-dehydroquinate dehydratase [Clostridium estertheticum]MBX4266872.1 type I 3-dehydroquinate dehydratase [Clostridium estertheticum]MBX4271283.1 type I 3-dehydroquinate dehydratase [Clostridium estertheticum]WLC78763.1 type I 3-dehydroquinate dehydratase [Clostridium estertheticum]WLC89785.1 type I 3-dehydroquinate dehydratase [Clostridium estertheticum]